MPSNPNRFRRHTLKDRHSAEHECDVDAPRSLPALMLRACPRSPRYLRGSTVHLGSPTPSIPALICSRLLVYPALPSRCVRRCFVVPPLTATRLRPCRTAPAGSVRRSTFDVRRSTLDVRRSTLMLRLPRSAPLPCAAPRLPGATSRRVRRSAFDVCFASSRTATVHPARSQRAVLLPCAAPRLPSATSRCVPPSGPRPKTNARLATAARFDSFRETQ